MALLASLPDTQPSRDLHKQGCCVTPRRLDGEATFFILHPSSFSCNKLRLYPSNRACIWKTPTAAPQRVHPSLCKCLANRQLCIHIPECYYHAQRTWVDCRLAPISHHPVSAFETGLTIMSANSFEGLYAVCGSFMGLSAITVGLRFYSRTKKALSYGVDDYAALFGVVYSSRGIGTLITSC